MSLRRLLVGSLVAVAAGLLTASGGLSASRGTVPTPSATPAATPSAAAPALPGSSPSPAAFPSLPLFGNGPAAGPPTQNVRCVHARCDQRRRRPRPRPQGRRALPRSAAGQLRDAVHHLAVDRQRRRRRCVRGPRLRPAGRDLQARRQARDVGDAQHALRRRQGHVGRGLAGGQRRRLGHPSVADHRRGCADDAHVVIEPIDLPLGLRGDRRGSRQGRRSHRRCRGCW